MKSQIEQIVASVPKRSTPLTYYHELSPDLYSATSSTFIGQIYGLLGLQERRRRGREREHRLSAAECRVPRRQEPRLRLPGRHEVLPAGRGVRRAPAPGWSGLNAVKNSGVVQLDDDIASRWGPRIVSYLRTVAARVAQAT